MSFKHRVCMSLIIAGCLVTGCEAKPNPQQTGVPPQTGVVASNAGSQYIGHWVNIKDAKDAMVITQNGGDQYLVLWSTEGGGVKDVAKIGATYKDGILQLSGWTITYVKSSDTFISSYNGDEYKRTK